MNNAIHALQSRSLWLNRHEFLNKEPGLGIIMIWRAPLLTYMCKITVGLLYMVLDTCWRMTRLGKS
jgi:hypothetical protein